MQFIRDEVKRVHTLIEALKLEQQSLEQADWSEVQDILSLARHMQEVEHELAAEIQKYILNIERARESLAERLGLIHSDDELSIPSVTERGLFELSKPFTILFRFLYQQMRWR